VVRLLPIAPYGLVSYAYGSTAVSTRAYLFGTFIGAAPSAATYAGIGAAANSPHGLTPLSLAPAVAGLLISATALLLARRSAAREHRPLTPPR
jgi:uncharacterized membrane protein YdjX (TVP38/TMEM64 family)